jgi:HAMP domain-containing protein
MILIATLTTTCAFALILWAVLRANAQTVDRLVTTIRDEAAAHRDETQKLLQRIQAPQQAVLEHAVAGAGAVTDGRPLTEVESAQASDERLKMQMLVAQVEAMENDPAYQFGAAE